MEGFFFKVTFVNHIIKETIIEYLNHIDTELFLLLNGLHSPFWDVVFSWITSRTSWIPVCGFLVLLLAFRNKWQTLYFVLIFGLLFTLSDQISVQLFKNVFERLRPSHQPALEGLVHVVGTRGGQFGFVSSHATNSFALAVFMGLIWRKHYRFVFPLMLLWAILVSYSRIYVGVHYPGDILGGAILGSIIAIFVYYLTKWMNTKIRLKIRDLQ